MTSKTFKSVTGQADLTIEKQEGGVAFVIVGPRGNYMKAATPPEAAAGQALAVLEAAGWPNEHLATTEILRRLRELDEHVKAVEAEARERAELEAEALELFNLHESLQSDAETVWLAVARRAREIAKEATK